MARMNFRKKQKEILRAEVSDTRQIATILKTINLSSETKATVTIQDDGISFTVQIGSTVLARAHLHHEHNFTSFAYSAPSAKAGLPARKKTKVNTRAAARSSSATLPDDDEAMQSDQEQEEEERAGDDADPQISEFEISLSALLNCINIFGESTVRPVSAKQAAAREKWKARQNVGGRNGGEGNDNEEEEDPYEQRRPAEARQGANAVNTGKKKGTTAMVLSWEDKGCPLVLLLEENGIVTRCEITTFDSDEVYDLPYDDEERMQKLILNSSWLGEALSEIDSSCERLTLLFAPPNAADIKASRANANRKGKGRADDTLEDEEEEETDDDDSRSDANKSKAAFALEGSSNTGSFRMEYPLTKEVLELCECSRSIRNSYRFASLTSIRSALAHSTKTSLRTDSAGILSMQFMIASVNDRDGTGVGSGGFVEFTCMPLSAEDD